MDGLIAYALSKRYTDDAVGSGSGVNFKVSIQADRSILEDVGEANCFYFIPKNAENPTEYEKWIYANDTWGQIDATSGSGGDSSLNNVEIGVVDFMHDSITITTGGLDEYERRITT
jgi:hypothetical protein